MILGGRFSRAIGEDGKHRLGLQRHQLEQALSYGQADDAQIDLVFQQPLDDAGGGAGRDHQLDVGMLRAQAASTGGR